MSEPFVLGVQLDGVCALRPGDALMPYQELAPGARLLLYTDGLPETARRSGEPLGYRRLAELIAAAHGDGRGLEEPAGEWLDGLLECTRRVTGRGGARPDDDTTALLVENRPQ